VNETTSAKASPYAMIIGMDMLTEIGLVVNTATKTIDWFEASTPMKQRGQLHEAHYIDMCYHIDKISHARGFRFYPGMSLASGEMGYFPSLWGNCGFYPNMVIFGFLPKFPVFPLTLSFI
jgi:hypothetical protein